MRNYIKHVEFTGTGKQKCADYEGLQALFDSVDGKPIWKPIETHASSTEVCLHGYSYRFPKYRNDGKLGSAFSKSNLVNVNTRHWENQETPEPSYTTDDATLAAALDILARDIVCEDGVATACIQEAAQRIRELSAKVAELSA